MDYKAAKSYLDGILNARRQITRLELSIARIREEIVNPYPGGGYGDKVQTSPQGDALERKVIKYVDLLRKHENAFMEYKEHYERIIYDGEVHIMQMPEGKPKQFLLAHYIDGVSEIDYGVMNGYETTVSVYNLKIRSIRTFANFFLETWW